MAQQEDAAASQPFLETLKLQLSELDMLQSMFPNHGEFLIENQSVLADVNDYVEGKTNALPARLDFVIQLVVDDKGTMTTETKSNLPKFELSCSLPQDYPMTEPEVFVRSQCMGRAQQHELNEDLLQYVNQLERGELCMFSIIQWLQDGGTKYVTKLMGPEKQDSISDQEDKDQAVFTRYWIYSHHIYNKMKRRNILDFARELDLTGFCLPGKPGIICAEGTATNCGDFWHRVKHMNWKKIMCKMKERIEPANGTSIQNMRRFESFEEVVFDVRHGSGREYHMDMGEFFKYLEKRNCGYAFKNYFGVDGKVTAHE